MSKRKVDQDGFEVGIDVDLNWSIGQQQQLQPVCVDLGCGMAVVGAVEGPMRWWEYGSDQPAHQAAALHKISDIWHHEGDQRHATLAI